MNNSLKYIPAVLVLILGISLTVFIHIKNEKELINDKNNALQIQIENDVNSLTKEIQYNFKSVEVLKYLIDREKEITKNKFKNYTSPLLVEQNSISALSWLERVDEAEKLEFESAMQNEYNSQFYIKERDRNSIFKKASKKPVYFPVTYIEPFEQNKTALGFDISSNKDRKIALDSAFTFNKFTISAKIKLVQDTTSYGFLGVIPLYENDKSTTITTENGKLRGYISAVFKINETVQKAINPTKLINYNLSIFDTSTSPKELLYNSNKALFNNSIIEKRSIKVANKTWELNFIINPLYFHSKNSYLILFGGIISSVLLFIILIYPFIKQRKQQVLEAKLKESETHYKALVEQSISGVYTFSKDKFHYVNDRFCEMFGYSKDEILNTLKPTDVVQKQDEKNALKNINDRLQGKIESVHYIAKGKRKDNKELWIEIHGSHIELNGEQLITGTVIDITEKYKAAIEIKESENKFRSIFEASNVGKSITLPSGEINVNQAFCDLLGYTKDELKNKTWQDLTPEEEILETQNKLEPLLSGKEKNIRFTKNYIHKNGAIITADVSTVLVLDEAKKPQYFITTIVDITAQKKSKLLLIESEANLSALINNSNDSIWSIDKNYNYIIFNKTYATHFLNKSGIELEKGMNAKNYLSEEDLEFWESIYEIVFKGNKKVFEFSVELDGAKHYFQTSINPIYENGEITGAAAMSVDISNVKNAEAALIISENKYRYLFENNPQPMWIFDLDTLAFLEVNDAAIEHYGYTRDEFLKMTIKDIRPTEDIDLLNEHINRSLNKTGTDKKWKDEAIKINEWKHLKKNGDIIFVEIKSYDTEYESKKARLVISFDITERKRMASLVVESEKQYRELFEHMNNGFVLFEVVIDKLGKPIDLIIKAANKEFEKTTSLELEKVIGKRLTQVLPGIENDDADWIGTYGEIAITGGRKHFEEPSEILGYHYTVNAYQASQNHCAVTFLDITDRKLAEEKLKKNEQYLSVIYNNSELSILVVKVLENGDFIFEGSNPKHEDLVGISNEQLIGKTPDEISEFIGEDTVVYIKEMYTKCKTEKISISSEFFVPEGNNKGWWLSIFNPIIDTNTSKVERLIITGLKIDEIKQAEAALKKSEERLRLSTELANVAVWEYSFITNNMERTDNHDALYGIQNQGKWEMETFLDATHPDDKEMSASMIMKSKAKGGPDTYQFDFRVVYPDKSVHWLAVLGHVTNRDENGIATSLRGTLIDITDRKNIEEEIQKLNEELEQKVLERTLELKNANKELEAFSYSISHDLRAPLRAINGFSNFLYQDYSSILDEEGKRFIDTIRQSAIKMDRLISDLLNFSRVSKSSLKIDEVDMEGVIFSMFHEMANETEKDEFEFIINDIPRTECDIILIKQVWQNLIGNALKYSSKSTLKKIEISAIENEKEIIFNIKDYGAGFNVKYKDKLFGVFQRLHTIEEFEGTGIGLAIVQRIVNRHGGKVWAEGEENKGANFFFSIPKNSNKL